MRKQNHERSGRGLSAFGFGNAEMNKNCTEDAHSGIAEEDTSSANVHTHKGKCLGDNKSTEPVRHRTYGSWFRVSELRSE